MNVVFKLSFDKYWYVLFPFFRIYSFCIFIFYLCVQRHISWSSTFCSQHCIFFLLFEAYTSFILSFIINVFNFWLCWVFVDTWALLSWKAGSYSSVLSAGFSLQWLLLLRSTGSWHRLSSCGPWAYLLCRTWDLPRAGIEPVSPALAGGILSTVPPGKS